MIDQYMELTPNFECLTEHGITLGAVQDMLAWVRDIPQNATIHLPSVNNSTFRSLTSMLVDNRAGAITPEQDVPSDKGVYILCDLSNDEVSACARVLQRTMLPAMVDHPGDIPEVFIPGQKFNCKVRLIICVCTVGCFQNKDLLDALVHGFDVDAGLLPVIGDTHFRVLSGEALLRCPKFVSVTAVIDRKSEDVAAMLNYLFKFIAVSFAASHAGQSVLELAAQTIVKRIRQQDEDKEIKRSDSLKPQVTGSSSTHTPRQVPDSRPATQTPQATQGKAFEF